jgi:UDP-N-acetylmuramoyl-L-alanyl-D-glutamate--2,6-diaminopimelate ligase
MKIDVLMEAGGFRHHRGPKEVSLIDLTDDSRRVQPGYGFVARGSGDTLRGFIAHAVERGAAAVFSEPMDSLDLPDTVAWCCRDRVDQKAAGHLAECFFGEPGKRLALIGVTGTNGKTTTAMLIQHLLTHAGVQTGVIGTIHTDDGTPGSPGGRRPAELTTPGAIDFSRELARMADAGCRAVAVEVSSHALQQGRASAYSFRTAVFTNLSQDHLDYHHTMQAYAQAKAILFTQLASHGQAVVNADDPRARTVLGGFNGQTLWTSMSDSNAEGADESSVCRAEVIQLRADTSIARFVGPWGSVRADLPLVGEHNVCNTLQAIAAAHSIADLSATLQEALGTIPQVPGRLERVRPASPQCLSPTDAPPTVLVDYAHTPDALTNALRSLRAVTPGRLIVMFGCGGDRDKEKRPMMAKAVCDFADKVYLTSDNPRGEDPDAIIRDALAGVPEEKTGDTAVIADRAKAIRACVFEGAANDTVLLAGKGHEDYQTIGSENIHFDDREHAEEALREWSRLRTVSP